MYEIRKVRVFRGSYRAYELNLFVSALGIVVCLLFGVFFLSDIIDIGQYKYPMIAVLILLIFLCVKLMIKTCKNIVPEADILLDSDELKVIKKNTDFITINLSDVIKINVKPFYYITADEKSHIVTLLLKNFQKLTIFIEEKDVDKIKNFLSHISDIAESKKIPIYVHILGILSLTITAFLSLFFLYNLSVGGDFDRKDFRVLIIIPILLGNAIYYVKLLRKRSIA